jgi:ubiquitin-protein ligase
LEKTHVYSISPTHLSSLDFITKNEIKLIQAAHTDITKLKLCIKGDGLVQFLLDKSPFDMTYIIEIKVTPHDPAECVKIRFLTPIYHTNVNNNGE